MSNKEERWYSTDVFVAACTAAAKITEATGGMVATIDEINTFQELLKQQGFSILPIEYANQDKRLKWVKASDRLPDNLGSPDYHFRLNGVKVNGNFFDVNGEGKLLFEVRGSAYEDYYVFQKDFDRIEWLDEPKQ